MLYSTYMHILLGYFNVCQPSTQSTCIKWPLSSSASRLASFHITALGLRWLSQILEVWGEASVNADGSYSPVRVVILCNAHSHINKQMQTRYSSALARIYLFGVSRSWSSGLAELFSEFLYSETLTDEKTLIPVCVRAHLCVCVCGRAHWWAQGVDR